MKFVYTFNEVNYGRVEIESDSKPNDGEIINEILKGKATFSDTDYTDFCLIEVDGISQTNETEDDIPDETGIDKIAAWASYLSYLRQWANTHADTGSYGMTPACFDEWFGSYKAESYMCSLHETPRTFDWCETNCDKFYSCDTVAWAGDDLNKDV